MKLATKQVIVLSIYVFVFAVGILERYHFSYYIKDWLKCFFEL